MNKYIFIHTCLFFSVVELRFHRPLNHRNSCGVLDFRCKVRVYCIKC